MSDQLTIALTKGRILRETLPLLASAGIVPLDDVSTSRKLVFDTTRAHERLGWSPRVDLDAAMARSEAWLREEGVIE